MELMKKGSKMNKLISKGLGLVLCFSMVLLSSCSDTKLECNTDTFSSEEEELQFWMNQFSPIENHQIISIENSEDGKYRFCRYVNNELEKEVIVQEAYEGCFYDAECETLYSYNRNKQQIEILNKDFVVMDILVSNLNIFEIKNIVKVDQSLYFLVVENSPYDVEPVFSADNSGYIDFGEKLYEINLEKRLMKEIEISNPICISSFEDGLQIYVYQQEEYKLLHYDNKSGELRTLNNMDDIGYLFAFAYWGNWIYYSGDSCPGLWKINMITHEKTCVNESAFIDKRR